MTIRQSTYLLLPGSDGRSSTWSRVQALLEARGHVVETPGGWIESGLTAQAAAIAELVRARGVDALVTWSYSGLVGTLAVFRYSGVRLLIHVDSLLPGFIQRGDELAAWVPRAVVRLVGDDIAVATTPVTSGCRTVVVACTNRPQKPAFAAVQRSGALAERTGLEVLWLDSGHHPMKEKPDELTDLLITISHDGGGDLASV